jgi:Zn-dependent protease
VSLLHAGAGGNGPAFHLAGIPVRLEWTFLLWTVLIGSTLGSTELFVGWVVVLTLSILVHELGHAAAFRGWGVSSRIVLHVMGGVTIPTHNPPTRWGRIVVSLAGPFTGLLLFGLPAILIQGSWTATEPWGDILDFVIWVNVGWAVVNLLPVLPLDGGHVAHELLDAGTRGRGEVPARVLSIAVAAGVGIWAATQDFLFGAVFAGFFVLDNARALGSRREQGAVRDLKPAVEALESGHTDRALELARGALDKSKDNEIRALATEIGAWAALEAGNRARAQQILGDFPRGLEPSGHLQAFLRAATPADQVNATVDAWLDHHFLPPRTYVHQLHAAGLVDPVVDRLVASRADDAERARMGLQHALFLGGQFDASAKLGEAMLGMGTTEPIVAYNTACAHARAGRLDRAFAWLDRGIDLGFRSEQLLAEDPDLATVRADPRYALLRNRIEDRA